jgi:nucleoside-diphosphate-sugar epimerase
MQISKVLVTGGTGVIASWAVREFEARGIEPIIFVRGQASDAIGKAINGDIAEQITRVQGDVLDPMSLIQAVRGHRPDAIVHLASAKPWQMEPPWVVEPKPRVAIDQIVHGTINVLDTARAFGIQRVVYAGSKASYASVVGEYGAPTY